MAPEVLEEFLLRTLQPLSAADPELLSDYVAALLRNDKSIPELRKLCQEQLWDFLRDSTQKFVDQLFEAIEDGTIELPKSHLNVRHSEPPSNEETPTAEDADFHQERWSAAAGTVQFVADDEEEDTAPLVASDPAVGQEGAAPHPVVVRVPSSLARLAGRYDEQEDDESEDEEGVRRGRRGRRSERSQSPPLEKMQQMREGRGGRESWRGRGGGRANGRLDGPLQGRGRGRFGGREEDRFRGRGMGDAPRWIPPAGPNFNVARGPMAEWRGPLTPEPGFAAPPPFEHGPGFIPFRGPPFPPGPRMPLPPGPDFGRLPKDRPPFFDGPERWEPFDARMPPPGSEYEMRARLMQGVRQPRPKDELRKQKCPEFFGERGYCLRGRLCPYDHGEDVEVVKDEQALRQLSLAQRSRNLEQQQQPPESEQEFEGRRKGDARQEEGYDPDTPLWDDGTGGNLGRRGLDAERGGAGDAITLVNNNEAGPSGRPEPHFSPPGGYLNPQRQGTRGLWEGRFPGGAPDFDEIRSEVGENERFQGARLRGMAGRGGGRSGGRRGEQPQADKTLFVVNIPAEQNTIVNLLKHFKKFGHVVIRPFGGDKAHVLFQSHEEAEKAHQSPDAVLGNRFIKVLWAKEDLDLEKIGGKYGKRDAGEGQEEDAKSSADDRPPVKPAENGISKGHAYIRPGSENAKQTEAQRVAQEKAALALKIKQLEASVLEARIAEQKRALAELERKTGKASVPDLKRAGSEDSTPAAKKAKLGGGTPTAAPWAKKGWGSGSFKSHLKLDNRSTTLRIMGEMPPGASKDALRMHFWRFGEVVTVQVPDDTSAGVAAKVVFRQRHDAEAALEEGSEWEGHPLNLAWGPPFKAAPPQPALSPKPPSSMSAGKLDDCKADVLQAQSVSRAVSNHDKNQDPGEAMDTEALPAEAA